MSIPKSLAFFLVVCAPAAAAPQQPTPEIMPTPAHLFPLPRATAGASTAIAYWLDGRAHAVRLDIRDPAGQTIRVLAAPRQRGVNRVEWDLRFVPAGVDVREAREDADLKKLPFPLVTPGHYTVN